MNTAHTNKLSGLGVFLAAMVVMLAGAFLATEARAQTASSTATSSNDISGTVTSTTTEEGISNVYVVGSGNGTATFKWTTANPSTSWVSYGLLGGAYTSVTPVSATLTTDHAVTVTGLTTDTAYHYAVSSRSGSGATVSSLDRAFVIVTITNSGSTGNTQTSASASTTATTTATTAAGTATTTEDVSALHARIADLESQLANLWAQFQAYIASVGLGNSGSSNGTTTSSSAQSATVSTGNSSARLGTNVDFTGHGFWANEPVEVSTNGSMSTTAHADSMGNFSTGSMPVQSTLGNQTYTFRGAWSGMTATGMVNVIE